MKQVSDVSLYIPARNAAATLERCLDGVRKLNPAPAQVFILLDETSRDNTVALARASGFELLAQQRPGLSAARNQALAHAHHRWVASIDADVVVASDWLGKLGDMRRLHPDILAFCGRTEESIVGPGDLWRALMHPHHWGSYPLRGPFMLISEALMDRHSIAAVGGYREALTTYGEDSRLSRDLRDAGYRLGYTPFARAAHIRHDDPRQALDLRWQYARPRAQAQLEDLQGLASKTAKNIEFAELSLARARTWEASELMNMAVMLPLHHANLDLLAMLTGRGVPLDVANLMRGLQDEALREVASAHQIEPLYSTLAAIPSLPAGTSSWPAFADHLAQLRAILDTWLAKQTAGITRNLDFLPFDESTRSRWEARCGAPSQPELPSSSWPPLWSLAPESSRVTRIVRTAPPQSSAEIYLSDDQLDARTQIANHLARVERLRLHYRPSGATRVDRLSAGELAELFGQAEFEILSFETHVSETTLTGVYAPRGSGNLRAA